MFQNILRSLSGSFADLAKWEPGGDRSESGLRNGLEKVLLFLLCSTAILGVSALTLGISQQTVYCDRGLAFWNGFLGAILIAIAAGCSSALFYDPAPVRLLSRLIWTNCESSFFEFGTSAFSTAMCIAAGPLAALVWVMRGWVDLTSSPTCRNTAALLFGGTITNVTLTISALSFASMMASYYVASSKRFYDIAILSCVCDPVTVAVDEVALRLPAVPAIRLPVFLPIPSFDDCVAQLPSYEKTRAFVKRVVETVTPVSLPQRLRDMMEIRVY